MNTFSSNSSKYGEQNKFQQHKHGTSKIQG